MSMDYIRDTYGVPAKRGGRVEYTDSDGRQWSGVIRSAKDGHLRIAIEGWRGVRNFHPAWNMRYLDNAKPGEVAK